MGRKNISKNIRLSHSARIVFGDVVYDPGSSFGPRIQRDYQLVVLEEGSLEANLDGEVVTIRSGEVALLLPEKKESFHFDESRKSRHTWCATLPSMLSDELVETCQAVPRVLPVSRRLAQVMKMGLSLPSLAGSSSPGLLEALGMATLQEYLYSWRRLDTHPAEEPDAIRRAIEWIGRGESEKVDLASLSKNAGVSAAQLVKLFKRHLGTTPMRYVWETRTRRGAQLLRETGLTVSEIAFRSGFQTPFHFSRWVKQVYGVSPKAFRAQSWGNGLPRKR